jgi:hypothetical protein
MARRKPPNLIRVQLDVVVEVPGERIGPLLDVSLVEALMIGFKQLGVNVRGVSRGFRKLSALASEREIPRRLR